MSGEKRLFDPFGDLLLNAEIVARVLNHTATLEEYNDISWRIEQLCENLACMLHCFGGVINALDIEEIQNLNLPFDLLDLQRGYGALMQMSGGLMLSSHRIQAACYHANKRLAQA